MLDKTTTMTNVSRYAEAVRNMLNPNAIILYGSYVNGEPTDNSDIDIAVIMNHFSGDRLETSSKLWGLTWDIDDRIEPILLDSSDSDSSGFISEVLKTGQVIYHSDFAV